MDELSIIEKSNIVCREFKDLDRSSRIVGTYYALFDGKADADNDIAVPGMTLKTIKEWGPSAARPRIKNFLNHDPFHPIGLPIEMGEDAIGAWGRAKIGTHDEGNNFLKMVDSGLVKEASYMLNTLKRDPKDKRKQLEVRVHEWSNLTHWGANGSTYIYEGVTKSLGKDAAVKYWQDRIEAIEKFCRNTDATDDCIQHLLFEIKCLSQFVLSLTSTTTADEATPVDEVTDAPRKQALDLSGLIANIKSVKF